MLFVFGKENAGFGFETRHAGGGERTRKHTNDFVAGHHGALMVGGERAGDASAIRVNARDDESELGKTAKVFSLAEDESDALFQDSKPKAKHASKSVEHYAREQAKRKPAADVAEGPAPKKAAKGTMHGGSKSTKKSKPFPEEDSDVEGF